MPSYTGTYVARVNSDNGQLTALVPQVFQSTAIPLDKWAGRRPTQGEQGFVTFINGEPEWPVWVGTQLATSAIGADILEIISGGTTEVWVGVSPPVGDDYVLWYDTDEPTVAAGSLVKGDKGDKGDVGIGVPAGGNTDYALGKTSNADYETSWRPVAPIRRPMNLTSSPTWTPALTDENSMVALSSMTTMVVTMPNDSTVSFPRGAEIDFVWISGTAQPVFVGAAGVNVYSTPGPKLRAVYSAATVKKTNTNEWVVIGDLVA